LLAGVYDLPIFAGWVAITAVIGLAVQKLGLAPTSAIGWDVYAWSTLVAPCALTLAGFESSRWQASPGKRRQGLVVTDTAGQPLTRGRALLRAAIKLSPWQMAHTAVFQMYAGSQSPIFWALSILAQVIVLASVAAVLWGREGRAFHDRIAGTRVVVSPTNKSLS